MVDVDYEGQHKQLQLMFVESLRVRALLGVPWIDAFNAVRIKDIDVNNQIKALLREFDFVFDPSTGCIKRHVAHLNFKPGTMFKMNKV